MPDSSLILTSIPFVGRHKELQRLLGYCAQLEQPDYNWRHLIIIAGPAGVGKTKFAETCLLRLNQEQRTLTGQSAYNQQLHRQLLAPLLDVIGTLAAERFVQRRLRLLLGDSAYHPLLMRLPELAAISGIDARDLNVPPPSTETLSNLIVSVLSQIARLRPVVALIDDLQWASDEEHRALQSVITGLKNAPVLLLGTLRSQAGNIAASGQVLIQSAQEHIVIHPLSRQEISELITAVYSVQVSARLAPDIAKASEGLAFRALELLRALAERGVLATNDRRQWYVGPGYTPDMLSGDSVSDDRLRRLSRAERRVILLLDCAGGVATGHELGVWYAMVTGDVQDNEHAVEGILQRLEEAAILRRLQYDPDTVVFAHDSIGQAQRRLRSDDDIAIVARIIVQQPEFRNQILRWSHDQQLFRYIMLDLPEQNTPERDIILSQLIGRKSVKPETMGQYPWTTIHTVLLDDDVRLTHLERARVLESIIVRRSQTEQSILSYAEQLYQLTQEQPECRTFFPMACVYMAMSYHSLRQNPQQAAQLLQSAIDSLPQVTDQQHRLASEVLIEELSAQLNIGHAQQALVHVRRAYGFIQQIEGEGRERDAELLAFILLYSARARDKDQFRAACAEFLSLLSSTDGSRTPVSFLAVSLAVRSSLAAGEIILAQQIYETWESNSTILGIANYVGYCSTGAFLTLSKGEPAAAAEMALGAMEEYARHIGTTGHTMHIWHNLPDFAQVQAVAVNSLTITGRHYQALQLATGILQTADDIPAQHDTAFYGQCLLDIHKLWLAWRCQLPHQAWVLLAWDGNQTDIPSHGNEQPQQSARLLAAAEQQFRDRHAQLNRDFAGHPHMQFILDMLMASVECWNGNFGTACTCADAARDLGRVMYVWTQEIESRTAAVTIRLRWAANDPAQAKDLTGQALDQARWVFSALAERGLNRRIEQLRDLFMTDSALIEGNEDYSKHFERIAGVALTAAHSVMQNSRSTSGGPSERTRLFIMGPLRVMRPYSYLELSDGAFEREAARTLLIALLAAAIMGQRLTREELAARIAPLAKTPEQQKKALYNAASAVRNACGSADSILNVGSNSLELNVDTEHDSGLWVDAIEIVQAVRSGGENERSGMFSTAFDQYRRALTLARKGDFATDCYEDWADAPRDYLRDLVRQGSVSLCRLALRNGRYPAGIEAAIAQLTRDPFDEESHRLLMQLYNDSGNRSAALRQFDKCAVLMMKEFEVEPEDETVELRNRIIQG